MRSPRRQRALAMRAAWSSAPRAPSPLIRVMAEGDDESLVRSHRRRAVRGDFEGRSQPARMLLTLLPLREKDDLYGTLLPPAGEGGAKRRMRAGAPAPVAYRSAILPLTFYSYCAYSPSARPAWGPGRDGGLGWGSSGGPAGRGKRTSGSRERNARPRGHYDPRAFGQLAGRHMPVSKRLAFCQSPAGRGRCTGAFDQPPSITALGSARATLSGPREATTPEAAGTASPATPMSRRLKRLQPRRSSPPRSVIPAKAGIPRRGPMNLGVRRGDGTRVSQHEA